MGICRLPTPFSISPMPAPVRATAWIWSMRILLTRSGSSPNVPAKIFSLTLPPEISRQRSPIRSKTLCHGEPSGARVPILISIGCARAAARNPNMTAHCMARRNMLDMLNIGTNMGTLLLLRRGRSLSEQVIDSFEQPARAALGDQVGQPAVWVAFGIDGQRLLDHGFELLRI